MGQRADWEKNFAATGFTQGYNRLLPIGVSFTAVNVVKRPGFSNYCLSCPQVITEKSEVKKE
jgi:hypothetical protein